MSRVPVTRRKMMKMLMILSRDRSNHTIICTERRKKTQRGRSRGMGKMKTVKERMTVKRSGKTGGGWQREVET